MKLKLTILTLLILGLLSVLSSQALCDISPPVASGINLCTNNGIAELSAISSIPGEVLSHSSLIATTLDRDNSLSIKAVIPGKVKKASGLTQGFVELTAAANSSYLSSDNLMSGLVPFSGYATVNTAEMRIPKDIVLGSHFSSTGATISGLADEVAIILKKPISANANNCRLLVRANYPMELLDAVPIEVYQS